jgi:hypothetical protein
MKAKLSILLSFMLFVLQGFTQRDKEFQIRLGIGAAGYATNTDVKYSANILGFPIKHHYTDEGGATTVHVPIELRYEVAECFNVGLDMRFGSYLYQDNESNSQSNAFRYIGLGAELTMLNRANSRLYLGMGVGSVNLEMREKITTVGTSTEEVKIKWRGPSYKMNLGFIKYFGDGPLGINFNLGVLGHAFNLKESSFAGFSFSAWDGKLNAGGLDMNIGLVFRIRQ